MWGKLGIISLMLIMGVSACTNENSTSSKLDVSLNLDTEQIPAEGGTYELTIDTQADWTAKSDVSWISVSPRYGSGKSVVTVKVDANSDKERNTNLRVETARKTEYVWMIQSSGKDDNGGNGGNTGLGDISKRIEIPKLDTDTDAQFIAHTTTHNGKTIANFSLEYIKSMRHARWVAFTYYNETAANKVNRTDAWADDPQIEGQYLATRSYYYGYDRGHIVASSDRVYSKEANEQTFYYSNISPMYGDFNQDIWTKFEGAVRNWGRNSSFRDTLYVVKGGTLDQVITYTTSTSYVPVPKYYFMALVNYKDKEYSGLAFWIEHRRGYSESSLSLTDYAISIDELQQKTGIDFFPNLPDAIENNIEQKLEKHKWPGM